MRNLLDGAGLHAQTDAELGQALHGLAGWLRKQLGKGVTARSRGEGARRVAGAAGCAHLKRCWPLVVAVAVVK